MGRWQVLYIAVSVGRYRIDRKDTRFLSIAKQEGRRGIMSQRERLNKIHTVLCSFFWCTIKQ